MIRDSSFLKFKASSMAAVSLIAAMNAQSALFRHQAKEETPDETKKTKDVNDKSTTSNADNASKSNPVDNPEVDGEPSPVKNVSSNNDGGKKSFEPSAINNEESSDVTKLEVNVKDKAAA